MLGFFGSRIKIQLRNCAHFEAKLRTTVEVFKERCQVLRMEETRSTSTRWLVIGDLLNDDDDDVSRKITSSVW